MVANTDHWHYEKVLLNGDILRTKVSHGIHKEIPGNTWKHILKYQLKTTEQEFNQNK